MDHDSTCRPHGKDFRQKISRDALAELGGSNSRKRRPYYILKCFGIAVCGSVLLIALTVFVWSHNLNFQAVSRARYELEERISVLEERLRASESRNEKAKLQVEERNQSSSVRMIANDSRAAIFIQPSASLQQNASSHSENYFDQLRPKIDKGKPADVPWYSWRSFLSLL